MDSFYFFGRIYLFQNEPSFRYNSAIRKYSYTFKGEEGEGRLKQILNYEYWNRRQDPKTNTTRVQDGFREEWDQKDSLIVVDSKSLNLIKVTKVSLNII